MSADEPWNSYSLYRVLGPTWVWNAVRSRNPLLRGQSRQERVVARLIATGLVAFALAGIGACLAIYLHGVSAERAEGTARHQVTATIRGVSDPSLVGRRYLAAPQVNVSYPFAGGTRTGVSDTSQGSATGSTVRLWVDARGQLIGAPRSHATTVRETGLVGLSALGLLALLAAAGRAGYDAWTLRRHADEWDLAWLCFDATRR